MSEAEKQPFFTPQRRRIAIVTGVVIAVLLGTFVVLQAIVADKVPAGTTVLGKDISHLSSTEATTVIEQAFQASLTQPITVQAEDQSAQVTAQELGIELDAQELVSSLTGFTLNPARLWHNFFGGQAVELSPKMAPQARDDAMRKLSAELDREPTNAAVNFADTTANVTPSSPGITVQVEGTSDAVVRAWSMGAATVEAVYESVTPEVATAQAEEAAETARKLVEAPLTFEAADQSGSLEGKEIAAVTTFDVENGALKMNTDWEKLAAVLGSKVAQWAQPAKDAKIYIKDSKPVIEPSAQGVGVVGDKLAAAVEAALASPERTATLELSVTKPALTTEQANQLGIKEIVSEFSTPHNSNRDRNANLALGMKNISNVLIKPGEEFSLEKALGPVTAEAGFRSSGVLVQGRHEQALGGGLSQVCVTTLNAAFFAGYDITEHKPHSRYFNRYPMGRECTLWTGVHDLKFTNNTPYGMMFQGWLSGGRVHVRVWSTKYWNVETTTSGKMGITPAKVVHNPNANCHAYPPGNAGFSVRVTRKTTHGDKTGKPINWSWRYQPDNGVVCDKDKLEKPEG
ncbi:VanW family protein [Boudabousia marimammalium]|uniref:YoaR-like putative peptidoglycan binding domain-containing protein n=1 Tax=Boudabousia marimammalium TaxID=156892 RepID=A0A1Q5PS34_9ACTO|nr:VanW family protein [Boudabousia marimammalium]OKL50242.1 hypothetical protein BM477_02295 [Boudabousia marimammalium]